MKHASYMGTKTQRFIAYILLVASLVIQLVSAIRMTRLANEGNFKIFIMLIPSIITIVLLGIMTYCIFSRTFRTVFPKLLLLFLLIGSLFYHYLLSGGSSFPNSKLIVFPYLALLLLLIHLFAKDRAEEPKDSIRPLYRVPLIIVIVALITALIVSPFISAYLFYIDSANVLPWENPCEHVYLWNDKIQLEGESQTLGVYNADVALINAYHLVTTNSEPVVIKVLSPKKRGFTKINLSEHYIKDNVQIIAEVSSGHRSIVCSNQALRVELAQ